MSALRATARRAATSIVTLLLVTLLVFVLITLAPGEPFGEGSDDDAPARLTAEARAELRRAYRLDEPIVPRYAAWIGDLLRGDLGRSFHDRRPVAEKIGERLGITVTLNAFALALTLIVAVPLGTAAALRPGSAWDRWGAGGGYVLYAVPSFWAALLLQHFLAVRLDWLPLAGLESLDRGSSGVLDVLADRAAHMVLPVVCLAYGGIAYVSRFVRATLLDSAAGTSWRAARARGVSWLGVLYRHGFRQAGVPLLTLAGFLVPGLVGGSVIVETVFAVPGLGRLFVDAAFQRDVPVTMALTLLSATATLAGVATADLLYGWVDPRARHE